MRTPPGDTAAELLVAAKRGNERALGKLVSLVERATLLRDAPVLVDGGDPSRAPVVGITGAPGVGKSTLVASLIAAYRRQGLRVAVIAIDPSSPFTGGALLGDRVRMHQHFLDRGVYIRSMSSRGHLGGLSSSTPDVVDLLTVCNFDVVVVETVGVGHAEIEIVSLADTVAVVVAAGAGDWVQAAKAGIVEIADVFVVNKADRPGAAQVAADLRQTLLLAERGDYSFAPAVLEASALREDSAIELVAELDRHRAWLTASGELQRRRIAHTAARLRAMVTALALQRVERFDDGAALLDSARRVVSGELGLRAAARALFDPDGSAIERR